MERSQSESWKVRYPRNTGYVQLSISSLPLPVLASIFVAAAAIVWWAGVRLSNTTDTLDRRLGWGHAFGGLILLAIVINLPDVAVVSSAAISGNVGLATGSLLGGVAVQVLVLAVLDIAGSRSGLPLTSRTRTLVPALEALMVIAALSLVLLGSQMEPIAVFRVEPAAMLIFIVWLAGLLVIRRANAGLSWTLDEPDDELPPESRDQEDDRSTRKLAGIFAFAAVLTLIGGVALEQSGSAIASRLGIGDVVFGQQYWRQRPRSRTSLPVRRPCGWARTNWRSVTHSAPLPFCHRSFWWPVCCRASQ